MADAMLLNEHDLALIEIIRRKIQQCIKEDVMPGISEVLIKHQFDNELKLSFCEERICELIGEKEHLAKMIEEKLAVLENKIDSEIRECKDMCKKAVMEAENKFMSQVITKTTEFGGRLKVVEEVGSEISNQKAEFFKLKIGKMKQRVSFGDACSFLGLMLYVINFALSFLNAPGKISEKFTTTGWSFWIGFVVAVLIAIGYLFAGFEMFRTNCGTGGAIPSGSISTRPPAASQASASSPEDGSLRQADEVVISV